MASANLTADLISKRVKARNISCTSMVATLFGDAISQHGNQVWLGSLIKALAPFGFSERLVRTTVFRLAQQGWLQVYKLGRRSFYGPTASTRSQHEKAERRIYSANKKTWDGRWTLVAPAFVPEKYKEQLRRSLLWQGYNSLVNGMFAHPSSETTSLTETLDELNLHGKVIVFSATTDDLASQAGLKALVLQKWNFSELQDTYRDFLKFYRPLTNSPNIQKLSPQKSFLTRSLLIHEYRRTLLRDPDFPKAMLPNRWAGDEANELVVALYAKLAQSSSEYIVDALQNTNGPLPPPGTSFYRRFGGQQHNR